MLNMNIDTEHREESSQSRALSIILEPKEEGDSLASNCQMQTRNCDKEEGDSWPGTEFGNLIFVLTKAINMSGEFLCKYLLIGLKVPDCSISVPGVKMTESFPHVMKKDTETTFTILELSEDGDDSL